MNETKPIRLWPSLVIIGLAAVIAVIAPIFFTRTIVHFVGLIGAPVLAAMAVPLWWLTFSRVRGAWRWWPVLAYWLPGQILWFFVYRGDFSVKPYQGQELKLALYLYPVVALVWVLWLVAVLYVRQDTWEKRKRSLIGMLLLTWGLLSLVRIDGISAEMVPELRWVWTPSAKELFEKQMNCYQNSGPRDEAMTLVTITAADCPEFRGVQRDGIYRNQKIRTDWDVHPPKELWRKLVGAGWGSFSVVAERAFTQEQRGNSEAVVCYQAYSGNQLWEYKIPARFYEVIAGEGPRATPTIHDSKLYAYGATGKLCCLDAATGKEIWLRDIVTDIGATVPQWGFASSPLVIDGKVIVFSAVKEKAVVAYSADKGDVVWSNGLGQHGYSSAHKATLHGIEQVLMVSDYGLESFRAADGTKLWDHAWTMKGQNRVAQPAIISDTDILLGTAVGNGQGARRIHVSFKDGVWTTEVVWNARGPKPYFNDGVVHNGHYYGFDDRNFVCVDLADGKIKWNARDIYGFGQVLLVKDQNLLLVQSEKGPVALVEASPDDYNETAKFPALKDKTWNHAVLVRGKLYVRNNVEAACYDIGEK
ncbi:PQQ-binding-like beta-propeller repeat protein [soil metagenome]